MKEIELTKEYLNKLKKRYGHYLSKADIYFDNDKVYKIFNTPEDFKEIKEKIEYFHTLNIPNITNPNEIIRLNNNQIGYSMDYFKGQNFKYLKIMNLELKLKYLNLAKQTLKLIHQNNILVGDLHCNNIMFLNDEIKFCDIDSYRINNEDTLLNYRGTQYLAKFGNIDKRCDIFQFNILTLAILISTTENDIRKAIINKTIASDNETINNILKFIGYLEENEDSEKYILDYIPEKKKEMVKTLIY